jgi:hypothetical protein
MKQECKLLLALAIAAVSAVSGQCVFALEKTDDIDTNRPSFMFSPLVVPKGSLQIENGTLDQNLHHRTNSFDISETQLRLGLLKNTEFQMFVPNWVLSHAAGQTHSGVSDLNEVGIKQQIPFRNQKLSMSFIGSMNIPTGNRTISGPGVQPVFRLPWGYALPHGFSLMGMQSLLVLNAGRYPQYQPDFMFTKAFGSRARTSVFAEYVGFFTRNTEPVQIAHFGIVRKLNGHHQVDCHFGFGLNRQAPAAFVGAGYSYRFDGLPYGGPSQ